MMAKVSWVRVSVSIWIRVKFNFGGRVGVRIS